MDYWSYTIGKLRQFIIMVGEVSFFTTRFFKEVTSRPIEFQEFLKQSYMVGYKSLPLVATTSLIMGMVLTIQTRPTLVNFGAVSLMPSMVGISIVREIGPVITALICAGKVGSGIGAELGSMRVTEQIDAMEVSGTNPFKYLVVTRILATSITLPILVILGDTVGLFGSFMVENIKGAVSFTLFFNLVFDYLSYGDLIPAIIKSFFFGFAIGLIGCYKGYNAERGTAGVGLAANSAVVLTSMMLFFIDFLAVLVADIFYEL